MRGSFGPPPLTENAGDFCPHPTFTLLLTACGVAGGVRGGGMDGGGSVPSVIDTG